MQLRLRPTFRIAFSLLASTVILIFANGLVYAQQSTKVHIAAGYYKGDDKYTIVASDKALTKLTMYVNGYEPTKATTNTAGWATFNSVKLSDDTGQLSFSKLYNGNLQPIGGYFPWYTIKGNKISFSLNPKGTTQQMSAWYNKYGESSMSTLTTDVTQLNSEGTTNDTAIEKTCTQLFDDAIKVEAKAPIPNNSVENSWANALNTLVNGAEDCQTGADDSDASQLTTAIGQISQGMAALNQASKAFNSTASATATSTKSPSADTTTATVSSSSVTTSAPTQSCTPLSDENTCYEPGEYCRDSDQGTSGIAGDGKSITCEDNDGWRWEAN
jgi:hypothetical protein